MQDSFGAVEDVSIRLMQDENGDPFVHICPDRCPECFEEFGILRADGTVEFRSMTDKSYIDLMSVNLITGTVLVHHAPPILDLPVGGGAYRANPFL